MDPAIQILSRDDMGRMRCRIEGGTLSDEWQASLRPGRVAWCEFTIQHGDDRVSSYGGEVWPMAWPALFSALRASAQTGSAGVALTAAGRIAVDRAIEEFRTFHLSLRRGALPLDEHDAA